jgi:hypothetical protein
LEAVLKAGTDGAPAFFYLAIGARRPSAVFAAVKRAASADDWSLRRNRPKFIVGEILLDADCVPDDYTEISVATRTAPQSESELFNS